METKETRKVPASAGRFNAGGANVAVSEDGKRFDLVPYAGQQFKHWFWEKLAFDVTGLSMRKTVIPAFKDHNPDKFVGEIDSLQVKNGKVVLSGAFAATPAAEEVRSTKKLEWECSLAFDLGAARIERVGDDAKTEVNGQKFDGPGHIVREAQIYETSFTFFGAVPGTEVAFNDKKNEVVVEVFSTIFSEKGEVMSEDLKKNPEDGKAEALGLFKRMNELCEDKAFVAECYEKGMALDQFQSELLKRLQGEKSALSKQVEDLRKAPVPTGAPAVSFNGQQAAAPEAQLDFVAQAKKLAKEEKIGFTAAASRLAKEDKALYANYVETCPVAKK